MPYTPGDNAPRDENRVTVLMGVSDDVNEEPTPIAVNPTTGAVIVEISATP